MTGVQGSYIKMFLFRRGRTTYCLTICRGQYGHLMLEIDDGIRLLEAINLDKHRELWGIWDWDTRQFDVALVEEFMTAAIDAWRQCGIAA